MSKIEVNTVEPQCGTTLTLGGSGDTVALGSGASQTGFGRTGTVDWVTTIQTSTPFTAVSGKGYFINTTAGAITMNLPTSPSVGDIVAIKDYAGTFATNNLTIGRGGSNMNGAAADSTRETDYESLTMVYGDATQGWLPVEEGTGFIGEDFIAATGGSPACGTTCGDYKIHTFTAPGTFEVTRLSPCAANNILDYVVVAGGGGGGGTNCTAGGGAGGGGFRYYTNTTNNPQPGAPGLPLNNFPSGVAITASVSSYPITVGAGGTAGTGAPTWQGCNGDNSVFSTVISTGGGGSAGYLGPSPRSGAAGGSGGGGSYTGTGGAGNTPSTPIAQGTAGGDGHCSPQSGGGGGGAIVAGSPGNPTGTGGAGAGVRGFGTTGESSGSDYYFSGGGGGATDGPGTLGVGGLGGGADGSKLGSPNPAAAGTINTGGGGGGSGGAGSSCGPYGGGTGGSGIVIIRYKFQ